MLLLRLLNYFPSAPFLFIAFSFFLLKLPSPLSSNEGGQRGAHMKNLGYGWQRLTKPRDNWSLCSLPNFPAHFYREKYPTKGCRAVASRVPSVLQASGISVQHVSRGFDHGVWMCFKNGTQDIPQTTSGLFPFRKSQELAL